MIDTFELRKVSKIQFFTIYNEFGQKTKIEFLYGNSTNHKHDV